MSHDAKLLHDRALAYHENPVPGKIKIEITKPAETADDLTLAYSPGVAEPVREIAKDPENAYRYTGKGNSVAIISNGTAILGLGNLGPLASKPVMEGKALLFKRFADINAIDIEVDNKSVEDFITTVECIANTFGGVNLEDIKAPECFEIERELIKRCKVPIFHDDQHGTAIVTTAGILNAVELQGKKIEDCKVVCVGAAACEIRKDEKLLDVRKFDPVRVQMTDGLNVGGDQLIDLFGVILGRGIGLINFNAEVVKHLHQRLCKIHRGQIFQLIFESAVQLFEIAVDDGAQSCQAANGFGRAVFFQFIKHGVVERKFAVFTALRVEMLFLDSGKISSPAGNDVGSFQFRIKDCSCRGLVSGQRRRTIDGFHNTISFL